MKKILEKRESVRAEGWSEWQPTARAIKISPEILAETLRGGQAFRWRAVEGGEGIFQGVWAENVVRVRVGSKNMVEWSVPEKLAKKTAGAVEDYFAADVDFEKLADTLPWRTDEILAARIRAWRGLRLLRQPLGETLLAFLCSSAKQIPHIMQICEKMAEKMGEPIFEDIRALPTWEKLAEVPESELRACSLGYRAAFIKQTAMKLAKEPGWEKRVHVMEYAEAQAWLAELPGVGPKIADCVLLFGAAKYEAFPVDTWILQAMAQRYGLHGWKPGQVAQFGRAHYGKLAGLAQQFLFSGERVEKKGKR